MIPCVDMSGANSRTRILSHKNRPHIVTPHNNWELHFNEHTPQQIIDKTDFFYRFRHRHILRLTAGQCDTLLSLGSPANWDSKQIHDESSDTDSGLRVSCPITVTIRYQVPSFTLMSWLQLQTVHPGIQHKLNNSLHLFVGC